MVFVLTQENPSSQRFYFKANRRPHVSLKNGSMDFKIALRLKDRYVFKAIMLKQIEWGVQNGRFTKNGFFTSDYFIFLKIWFVYKNLV